MLRNEIKETNIKKKIYSDLYSIKGDASSLWKFVSIKNPSVLKKGIFRKSQDLKLSCWE